MNSYKQLAYVQRYQISFMLKLGFSQTKIANEIGVHRSAISWELRRNRGKRGNRPPAPATFIVQSSQIHQVGLTL
jgi:IS30 family transposase